MVGPTLGQPSSGSTIDTVSGDPPQASAGPTVTVVDDRSECQILVDANRWAQLAAEVLIDTFPGITGIEMGLHFVDPGAIADLNRHHLHGDGPTDVMAFPLETPGEVLTGLPVLLGDVLVCPTVAARQAADEGRKLDAELSLLVVHGVLHLLGYDHSEPEERAVMQQLERELLEEYA